MSDMLEKAGNKADSAVRIIAASGVVFGTVGAIWGAVSGFFSLPSEVQKLREDAKALREIVVLQQAKIDTGLRGPQGERGPAGQQGIQGIAGERGPAGPKGDAGLPAETGRSISNSQISALIDTKIAEFSRLPTQGNATPQPSKNPTVSGLQRQSDGCHILPTRQVTITMKITSGTKICNENRSVSIDFFALEPSRNRIHFQMGTNQSYCNVGNQCNFIPYINEYLYRIDGFESNGEVAKLVFFRP